MKCFGKSAMIWGKWQWVELEKEDIKETLEKLLEDNMTEAERCMAEMEKRDIEIEFAKIIMDKQLTASFSALNNRLDSKISAMKKESPKKTV